MLLLKLNRLTRKAKTIKHLSNREKKKTCSGIMLFTKVWKTCLLKDSTILKPVRVMIFKNRILLQKLIQIEKMQPHKTQQPMTVEFKTLIQIQLILKLVQIKEDLHLNSSECKSKVMKIRILINQDH